MNNQTYQTKFAEYQLKDYDKDGTVIIVPASFDGIDVQGDITLKGSFAKTNNDGFGRLRYLYNHDTTRKNGEPLEGWEDNEGWIVKAVLNLNKEDGKNTYEDYKLAGEYKRTVEHSFGGYAIKTDGKPLNRKDPLQNPRRVSEWFVKEISYIPAWGANLNTPMLAIKSACDVRFLDYCIEKGNYTDERFELLTALQVKAATMHFDEPAADVEDFLKLLNF